MKNEYTKYLELEQYLIEMEKALEGLEQNKCSDCGCRITDKDILELTDTELILTYTCPKCGAVVDQYFTLQFDGQKVAR